jgi:transcriptional regulator GlxA family with amidase domain
MDDSFDTRCDVRLRAAGAGTGQSPPFVHADAARRREGRNHIHPAVHRVQDAIARDAARTWTLGQLAKIADASSRHLSRLFHEHVGMSVKDYCNRLRVALAEELLSQTRLDMERVAERAGFSLSRQLRRAWRKLHANAPREARLEWARSPG